MTTQHTPSEYDGMLIPVCGARKVPGGFSSCGFTGGYKKAPHECDDPKCPGNVTRQRLLAFCEITAAAGKMAVALRVFCDRAIAVGGDKEEWELGTGLPEYRAALANLEKLG